MLIAQIFLSVFLPLYAQAINSIPNDERYNYRSYCTVEYALNGKKTGEAYSYIGYLEKDDGFYYSTQINRVLPGLDLNFNFRHTLTGPINSPTDTEPISVAIYASEFGKDPEYLDYNYHPDFDLELMFSKEVKFSPKFVVTKRADTIYYNCATRYSEY